MDRIIFVDEGHTTVRIEHEGGSFSGAIDALAGEFRPIYDRLLAEGVEPEPYEVPSRPVPGTVSDRQFFQALAMRGTITPQEAIEAVKIGAIPRAMQAKIDAMPPDQQFAATMLLAGATQFERHHPMTIAFAALMGWSAEDLDALWLYAAAL